MHGRHQPAGDGPATKTLALGEAGAPGIPRIPGTPDMPAGPVFLPGEVVAGRFHIRRLLGEGGTSQVFAAADLELGQDVAIKVLRPELDGAPDGRALLRREVLLARRITHPNVCRIFDVFQHPVAPAGDDRCTGAGRLVLVMELISGETLARRLARGGPLTPAAALPIIRQLADALDAAHGCQVVHGDFKSGNVLLEARPGGPRAVVADFGLAQPAAAGTGCGHGTRPYVAPELLGGGRVTPASDVYALGVVILEVVAGRLPDSRPQGLPAAMAAAALPAGWRRTLERCLAASPGDRPQSAGAVARHLAAGLSPPPQPAGAAVRGSRRRTLSWAGAACLLAALLGLSPEGPPRRGSVPGVLRGSGAAGEAAAGPGPESAAERAAARAMRPASPLAAGLYARGEELLARGELPESYAVLRRALAADPGFALSHAALARVCAGLWRNQISRQEAAAAEKLSGRLPERQRLAIAAIVRRAGGDPRGAAGLQQVLWNLSPHDADLGLQLAESQLAAGNPGASLEALRALRGGGVDPARAPSVDLLAARAHNRLSDPRAALAAALAAENGARRAGEGFVLAAAEIEECDARAAAGDPAGAARALDAAQERYRRLGSKDGTGEALSRLGILAARAGRTRQALALGEQALAIFEAAGNELGAAHALAVIGAVRQRQGEVEEAQGFYERSLQGFRSAGDPAGEAGALLSLANVLWGRVEKARIEKLLEDAVSLDAELGNREGEMRALNDLAVLEVQNDALDTARVHFEAVLRLAREARLKPQESLAELNIGSVRTIDGTLRLARPHLLGALRLAREVHRPDLESGALEALGILSMQENDFAAAESALRQALAIESAGALRMALPATRAFLARLQLMAGQFAAAEGTLRQAAADQLAVGYHRPSPLLAGLLAESQVGQGKLAAARRTLAAADLRSPAAKEAETRLILALAGARLALAAKQPLPARRGLEETLRRFASSPHPDLLFEARGLLAAADLAAGEAARGCGALRSLADTASSQGFALAASQAGSLLRGTPACKQAAPPGG